MRFLFNVFIFMSLLITAKIQLFPSIEPIWFNSIFKYVCAQIKKYPFSVCCSYCSNSNLFVHVRIQSIVQLVLVCLLLVLKKCTLVKFIKNWSNLSCHWRWTWVGSRSRNNEIKLLSFRFQSNEAKKNNSCVLTDAHFKILLLIWFCSQ